MDWKRFEEAEQKIRRRLKERGVFIDPTGTISIGQLRARARKRKRQMGTELIIVDYIQLMQATKGNRTLEITEITTGLKALAKELNVPILALSQLSRAVEGRESKRPQLSDLRESGSIEQDADVMMFVFREEYYEERRRPSDENSPEFKVWLAKMRACAGKAEIIIDKARHGAAGIVGVQFNPVATLFSNLARTEQENDQR